MKSFIKEKPLFILLKNKLALSVISVILLIILFLLLYKINNRFIYTFGFTDEGDNISIGKYLLHGKTLYKDIFSQHQPLTYYLSSGIQVVSDPDNVLLVVRRHRQFVLFFSFLWITFFIFRFRLLLLPFLGIIELLRYYFIGHLFLAESIVIYPLLYLFLLFFHRLRKERIYSIELIFASLSGFFIVFNLLPLAPITGILLLLLLVFYRKEKKCVAFLVSPFFIASFFLFAQFPLSSYIDSTIHANISYYIPKSNMYAFNLQQSSPTEFMNSLLQPFLYFFASFESFFILQRFLTLTWLFTVGVYIKVTRKIWITALLSLLLVASNMRPATGSLLYYHTFHSFPYFALFILSIPLFLDEIYLKTQSNRVKAVTFIPLVVLCGLLIFDKGIYYRESFHESDVSFINFSRVFTYSDVIKSLAEKDDTLAVIPYEELLYWHAGISPATRFLFYEAWVYDVPKYKAEITERFSKTPPTFVYWETKKLEPFLVTSEYVPLLSNATASALFVRKDKLPAITQEKWEKVKRHGFSRPKI